jgi:hypothetical protein
MSIVQILGLALGSAWTSGINLYATVAVLGLLERYQWAFLPGSLHALGNWFIIGAAIFLYIVEFVADKIPYVDTIWDAVHTFIRVPAGAVLAAAATSDINPSIQIVALLAGGGLAFSTHSTKAAARATVNLSPEPFSNWTLSLIEDVIAIGASIIATFHPLIIFGVIVVFLLVFAWIASRVMRGLKKTMLTMRNFLRGRPILEK